MQKHGGRLQFQSTLSQGERLCRRQTRQECKGISIHALARRATVDVDYNNDGIYISIHALARRATLLQKHIQRTNHISIHALARRATATYSTRVFYT